MRLKRLRSVGEASFLIGEKFLFYRVLVFMDNLKIFRKRKTFYAHGSLSWMMAMSEKNISLLTFLLKCS